MCCRAGIVPKTKVIESARSLGVVRPDKMKIFYTFMLGGGVISLLVVFVRVMFYDRIENADQLKELTTLPVYGEIIASEKGLGQALAYLGSTFNIDGVMALLLVLALLGVGVVRGMTWLEKRLLHWQ